MRKEINEKEGTVDSPIHIALKSNTFSKVIDIANKILIPLLLVAITYYQYKLSSEANEAKNASDKRHQEIIRQSSEQTLLLSLYTSEAETVELPG